jgi:Tol biopolymer transport system component/DNA-binding winged helix-turn-helix (wHTH) protein
MTGSRVFEELIENSEKIVRGSMPLKAGRFYEFGPYRLDAGQLLLWNHDELVPLTPKALETLLALVEKPGRLVGKDELMKRLWPDTFVEENNLAFNISVLRKALTDGQSGFAYIETIPKRGYRFIAPVMETGPAVPNTGTTDATSIPAVGTGTESAGDSNGTALRDARADLVPVLGANGAISEKACPQGAPLPAPPVLAASQPARLEARKRPGLVAMAVIGLIASVIACVWSLVRRLPTPVLVGVPSQLTHDSVEKRGPLLTDGTRLYFEEKKGDGWVLASIPAGGGEPSPLPLPFPDARVSDISSDGAHLLGNPSEVDDRIITWPVTGGPAEYVGGLSGRDPTWSPDGTRIAYAEHNGRLMVAGGHGGDPPRQIRVPAGLSGRPRWSPDGRRLRFRIGDPKSKAWSIWETKADGSDAHQIESGLDPSGLGPAGWAADSTYSLFDSHGARAPDPNDTPTDGVTDLWVRRENCRLLSWHCPKLLPITTGSAGYFAPLPGRDGKTIFAIGSQSGQRIERYDPTVGAFAPYLSGGPWGEVDFSRDGDWIAYIREPDHTLWRSKLDGSDARQLSSPALGEARWPHWSPDGSQIAFMAVFGEKRFKAYVVPATGGVAQPLVGDDGEEGVPTWSPDGKRLVWGEPLYRSGPSEMMIRQLDLDSQRMTNLPDSGGLWTPRWSKDGRYIAAVSVDRSTGVTEFMFPGSKFRPSGLWLFNVEIQKWTRLAPTSGIDQIAWADDSRYVYFNTLRPDRTVYRVSTSGGKAEPLVSLRGLSSNSDWAGVTPDGSPLVTHSFDIQEVYALDVDWP